VSTIFEAKNSAKNGPCKNCPAWAQYLPFSRFCLSLYGIFMPDILSNQFPIYSLCQIGGFMGLCALQQAF
jgi:hypothetical protein